MERLGEDEIFSIFERIPNQKDKKSFSKACKKFFKVACFEMRSLNSKSPLLYDLLTSSPKMSWFECHAPLLNNHMKQIAESCPNIHHLDLSLSQYHLGVRKLEFDDVGLCAIANACIHLDRVNLSGRLCFTEIGIGSLVRSCKNLTVLILRKCMNVTDKSLKMIGEATRLKYLSLRDCYLITDLGLEYLANEDLRYCLKTLYLNNCHRITDNGVIHLKKLVSLRDLHLSNCAYITDYGVVAICELPNLEVLHLDFLITITDISLREIGSKCLKMLVLSLEGCEKITNVGLQAFSGHQTLFRLSLALCYKLSLEDVKPIVMSCPNLRCLRLSRKPMSEACFELLSTNTHRCRIYWE
uniref:F-box/LRR-repeat protein 15-like leucin rich repeat domain-containing protein n=1 Tax=Tanacetum cinerariifolium TaxID=118510 RepID=A0A6L2L1S4_TANCI|nr:hypothetical protein [Tanacetum cinerariifolium]